MHKFSNNIINNLSFLIKFRNRSTLSNTRTLIQNATFTQLLAIVEICNDILNSRFILSRPQKIKLAKYGDIYRSISRRSSENNTRKYILKSLTTERPDVLSILIRPILKTIKDSGNTVKKSQPITEPSTCFIYREPQKTQEQTAYVVNSKDPKEIYVDNELDKERRIFCIKEGKAACPKCLKIFEKRVYLKKHLKNTHKSLTPFLCKYNPLCMELFKTERDKIIHMRSIHS